MPGRRQFMRDRAGTADPVPKRRAKKQVVQRHLLGPVWRTANGTVVPIKDMTDSHLLNTIHFIERAHKRYRDEVLESGPPMFQGEMAQFYAEREYEALLENDDPSDLYPAYNDLREEAALREDERARLREKHPWPPPPGMKRKVR